MKKLLIACTAVLLAAAADAQTTVRCESTDGKYIECRTKVKGGVTLVRQLSDNACVRGKSWGINQRGIWVDKGCRAQFAIGSSVADLYGTSGHTLICESNGGRTRCPVDTSYGVRIAKQRSKHACALGRDWGYDETGVWVDHGCRAEFTVSTAGMPPMTSAGSRPVILCESNDGHRGYCQADTTWGVTLSRKLSDANCIRGETWGYDANGIWVTRGCRAEFLLDTVR